jgi:hypothetical protein
MSRPNISINREAPQGVIMINPFKKDTWITGKVKNRKEKQEEDDKKHKLEDRSQ